MIDLSPGTGLLDQSDTRSSFLRKAGIGGAALIGGGALLGAGAGTARAGHAAVGDADVLNFALVLEYLEASFYVQALGKGKAALPTGVAFSSGRFKRGSITGSKELAGLGGRVRSTSYWYLSNIRDHEVEHVGFLQSALTAAKVTPVSAPTFDFSKLLTSVGSFLGTARTLENTGVMAYDGAIRFLTVPDYIQAGATIATVEARHASYLNLITKQSPFPAAFDATATPKQIIDAVVGLKVITKVPQDVADLFGRVS